MSEQLFPSVDQVMEVLMGELPKDVYATDRADDPDPNKRSVSSSEIRAHAQTYADIYANLKLVNNAKRISTLTADDLSSVGFWEKMLFATAQSSGQPFATRQANLFAKYRAQGGLSFPYINGLIASILTPLGLAFQQSTMCNPMGGTSWILDVSALEVDTILNFADPLLGAGRGPGITPLDCSLDYAAAGISAQTLADIQATAYTYYVFIYGNASAATLSQLDQLLTQSEKGGSTHVIINNAPLPPDPNVVDLGNGPGPVIDWIYCGSGEFQSPDDVWDFALGEAA